MSDSSDKLGVITPPTDPEELFTMIDGKRVKVVKTPEIKETAEPTIHFHNDLDQPGIDITAGLSGVSITSPANNDLLAFDSTSGQWINQTAVGAAVVPEGGTTTNLTLVQPTIGTMAATGGTATNLTLVTPTIGTPTLTGGTLTNSVLVTPTIGTMTATGGTATNLNLATPTIGTPTLTGGTLTNSVLVTPTIGTPTVTGGTATNHILVTPTIGTPSLTGGTLNPIQYNAGGTVGVDGTAVYVKTIVAGTADTWGTITFTKGIATGVS